MKHMQTLTCEAKVHQVEEYNGRRAVLLDKTVFYPQGGGQPYDTGLIDSASTQFVVEEVRFVDGVVLHIGQFKGYGFNPGDTVRCAVDRERRDLNTRLHSGGHLIDMAVHELGYHDWKPTKGYHFPDGPYVEYRAALVDDSKDTVSDKINKQIADILSRGIKTRVRFMPKENMTHYCHHVPDYLPAGKPSRIVLYGNFGVPCGGTHIEELGSIGSVKVRRIKSRSGVLRVSYEVS